MEPTVASPPGPPSNPLPVPPHPQRHPLQQRQRDQARAAGKFKMDKALEYAGSGNAFVGYESLQASAKVLALFRDGVAVNQLDAGQSGVVVLDTTPFYAESGGQVGDCGALQSVHGIFSVEDTQKIQADVFGHYGTVKTG